MRRREFLGVLGVRQQRGLFLRAHSRALRCGASACSRARARIAEGPASRPSCRRWRNWAGPRATTCGSTCVGAEGRTDALRKQAAELVALAPDVILASGPAVEHLLQATLSRADRICGRPRSGRLRPGREFVASWRQRHRLHAVRIQLVREMAGTAQGDRAGFDPGSGPSRSR